MSLKSFHIFFIVTAAAFSLWFGVWSQRTPGADSLLGNVSFGVGAILMVYLGWFLKKKVFVK